MPGFISLLIPIEPKTFVYDFKGRMTNDGYSGVTISNYNYQNLPLSINSTAYGYNGKGERITKNNEYYLRDYTGRELAIYDLSAGALKSVNFFGGGMIGRYLADEDENIYYAKDHLGTVRATMNETGEIENAMDYYPYGEEITGRSIVYPNCTLAKYKFTGKERDAETSYDYFGARYYDSKLGRWLQVDPLAEKYPSWSPYNYVRDNPLILIDPNGLDDDWYEDALGNARWVDSHEKNLEINGKTYENIGSSYTYKQGNWSYTFNQNELAKVEVNVMSPDQFISQFSLIRPKEACFRASSGMIEPFGITPAGRLSSGDIQISKNGENLATGVNAIENSLFSGNPIVVGEDYKSGSRNVDNKTDHFNVVMGASYNLENNTTSFRFFNPGRTTVAGGTSSSNVFNLTPNGLTRSINGKRSYISTIRINK